jgi:hypothetical protein
MFSAAFLFYSQRWYNDDPLPMEALLVWAYCKQAGGRHNMGNNEAKKTMRFWIFSGIVAIVASQLPLFIKKRQQPDSHPSQQQQQKKRPLWIKLLIGAVIGGFIRIMFWLYDFISGQAPDWFVKM